MRIVVRATEIQKQEWLQKGVAAGNEVIFTEEENSIMSDEKTDVFLYLDFN